MKAPSPRLNACYKFHIVIITIAIFLAHGCSFRFIAPYDEKTEEAIFDASKLVDQFYGRLLDTAEDEREYSKFSEQYILIESELKTLVFRNKVRSLNEDSTGICERILKLWRKYKEKHKSKDTYSTGTAKLDRNRFSRMFSYAARAEGAKKPNN